MTTRSLILHQHEVRAALRGELGLVVRPVVSVVGVGRVTEFGPSDTKGYDWGMRDRRLLWNDLRHDDLLSRCPLGVPGDRLCCRETWGHTGRIWKAKDATKATDGQVVYQIDHDVDGPDFQWWSPATMPSWASRITLEVVGVRCVLVVDLTIMDARVAGIPEYLSEFKLRPYTEYEDDLWRNSTTLENMRRVWESKYGTRYPWDTSWAWAVAVRKAEG